MRVWGNETRGEPENFNQSGQPVRPLRHIRVLVRGDIHSRSGRMRTIDARIASHDRRGRSRDHDGLPRRRQSRSLLPRRRLCLCRDLPRAPTDVIHDFAQRLLAQFSQQRRLFPALMSNTIARLKHVAQIVVAQRVTAVASHARRQHIHNLAQHRIVIVHTRRFKSTQRHRVRDGVHDHPWATRRVPRRDFALQNLQDRAQRLRRDHPSRLHAPYHVQKRFEISQRSHRIVLFRVSLFALLARVARARSIASPRARPRVRILRPFRRSRRPQRDEGVQQGVFDAVFVVRVARAVQSVRVERARGARATAPALMRAHRGDDGARFVLDDRREARGIERAIRRCVDIARHVGRARARARRVGV